ncbi:response regulator [Devosia sp. PTR5]|uniref:Response regulator n=1 Tax=Devosia oryzisoli TaxID=2774138 RepID=A0A927ITZ9_9HYPH|nr:response regulator [Devosia oryzisoli]MBD8066348.1 response regulator [Devosia oryzisoli]
MATHALVLIVEDEPLVSLALSDELERAGFMVVEAANAAEALGVLESRDDIDIIITDVDMPGTMDGLALALAVAHRWPPIRIIVVSGHHGLDQMNLPEGSAFHPKPYRTDQLVGTMRRMLG